MDGQKPAFFLFHCSLFTVHCSPCTGGLPDLMLFRPEAVPSLDMSRLPRRCPASKPRDPTRSKAFVLSPAHGGRIRRGGHRELVRRDFHGKPTSCGEPYDMWALTAAHKTLPLGSTVKVTTLRTNTRCFADKRPRTFVSGRVIDLSCKAAQELGCYGKGTAPVRVEAVQVASEYKSPARTRTGRWTRRPHFRYGHFMIQIGAFATRANAVRLKDRLAGARTEARISQVSDKGGNLYRVQVGNYQDLPGGQSRTWIGIGRRDFRDAFVLAIEGK